MPGTEEWMSVAASADEDDVREKILTGYKTGKPFTPYVPTIAVPAPVDRVLDFGCGLGRNFRYLKTIARHTTGFDLPPMIARCRAAAEPAADALADRWVEVRPCAFDLVFAALVLQHLDPDLCSEYLRDFARMAPATYVLTRADSDFGTNVFEAIAEASCFEAGECVEVEHDAASHQLRVLGSAPFDDVRRPSTKGHYEVLLRSRLRS